MNLIERIEGLPAITTEAHELAERRYGKDYLQYVPLCEAELIKQWRTSKQYFRIDVPKMKRGMPLQQKCACGEKYVAGFIAIVYLQPTGKYDHYEISNYTMHALDSPRHHEPLTAVRRTLEKIFNARGRIV